MYAFHFWNFEKIVYNVYKKCYDVLMAPYELNTIAILNVKGVDYRCIS